MKNIFFLLWISIIAIGSSENIYSQHTSKKIGFYGGFGLSLGTDYTYLSLQPGLLYHFHKKLKLGAGVQYTYLKSNKSYYGVNYNYNIFGFNSMILYDPIEGLETSLEYENLYVKKDFNNVKTNFWSPSLFAGLGYHFGAVVAGFKYNFLYDPETSIYQDAFIPFIRIYF